MSKVFFGLFLILSFATGILTACTTVESTYVASERFTPRPSNWPVEIIAAGQKVTKEYIKLARLDEMSELNVKANPYNTDSYKSLLESHVRSLGGDAVINFQIYESKGILKAYTVVGDIVRWK
jgi:hypothetical protein